MIYAHYTVRVSRDAVSFSQSPKSNRNLRSRGMGFRVVHKLCYQLGGGSFQMLTLDYGDGGYDGGFQIIT